MAENYGFFNAKLEGDNYDRVYKAEHFAKYFASFIGNGVFPNPSTSLQLNANSTPNMTVIAKAGKGWINGYWYELDADKSINVGAANASLPRKDRLILRLDFNARRMNLILLTGIPSSTPVAPSCSRTTDYYDLGLAIIDVAASAYQITQANITDTRLDNSVCGIVSGLITQVDTTTIFNQYQNWFLNNAKAPFDSWFNSIQNFFGGATGVATNIDGTDLNNLTTSGFYTGKTLTDAPENSTLDYYVYVIKKDNNNIYQEAYRQTTPSGAGADRYYRRFFRLKINGTWGTWNEIATRLELSDLNEYITNFKTDYDTTKDEYIAHSNNKTNPHQVTCAQIGAYTKQEADNTFATKATIEPKDAMDITNVDVNTLMVTGNYFGDNIKNGPIAVGSFFMEVFKKDTNNVLQIAIQKRADGGDFTYIRTYSNGVWNTWKSIVYQTMLDSVQTYLDNKKVNKTTQRLTDTTTDMNSILNTGFYDCQNAINAPYTGWCKYLVINNSDNNGYVTQIALGLDTHLNELQIRGHHSVTGWSVWSKMYNTVDKPTAMDLGFLFSGINGNATRLGSGTDFNTIINAGIYDCSEAINSPFGGWVKLFNIPSNNTNYITQIAFGLLSHIDEIWIRTKNTTVWSSWQKIITSSLLPFTNISGLSAAQINTEILNSHKVSSQDTITVIDTINISTDNTIIEGMKFANSGATYTFNVTAKNVTFRNCDFTGNVGHFILCSGAKNIIIDGCRFRNSNLVTAVVFDNCDTFTVTNCIFEELYGFNLQTRFSKNGSITNNKFKNSRYEGSVTATANQTVFTISMPKTLARNVVRVNGVETAATITNNGTTYTVTLPSGVPAGTIVKLIGYNSLECININSQSYDMQVVGNYIDGTGDSGVVICSDYHNGVLDAANTTAVDYPERVLVSDNRITNCAFAGIAETHSIKHGLYTNNFISDCGYISDGVYSSCIFVTEGYSLIDGNYLMNIDGFTKNGIHISGAPTDDNNGDLEYSVLIGNNKFANIGRRYFLAGSSSGAFRKTNVLINNGLKLLLGNIDISGAWTNKPADTKSFSWTYSGATGLLKGTDTANYVKNGNALVTDVGIGEYADCNILDSKVLTNSILQVLFWAKSDSDTVGGTVALFYGFQGDDSEPRELVTIKGTSWKMYSINMAIEMVPNALFLRFQGVNGHHSYIQDVNLFYTPLGDQS